MPFQEQLTFLATSVAVVASLVGVVTGIGGLLSGARLRGLAGTLESASASLTGDPRADLITSLHRATLARIIAREAVPTWRYLIPVLYLAPVLATAVGVTNVAGPGGLPDSIPVFITASGAGLFALKTWFRLIHERQRVARCYRDGVTPIRAFTGLLALVEGGGVGEYNRAFVGGVGLACLAIATGLFRSTDPGAILVGLGFSIAGLGLGGYAIGWAMKHAREDVTAEPRNRDDSLNPTWVHPAEVGS